MPNKIKVALIMLPATLALAAAYKPVCLCASRAFTAVLEKQNAADMQMLREKMRQYEHQKVR